MLAQHADGQRVAAEVEFAIGARRIASRNTLPGLVAGGDRRTGRRHHNNAGNDSRTRRISSGRGNEGVMTTSTNNTGEAYS